VDPEAFYSAVENDVDGQPFAFEQLREKVVFVMNVASK